MGLKIAQLSPKNQIQTQLEQFTILNQDYETIIRGYKKQVEQISPLLQRISKLEKKLNEYQDNFDPKAKSSIEQLQAEKEELQENLEKISKDFININEKIATQANIINELIVKNQKINNQLMGQWKASNDLRKVLRKERINNTQLKDNNQELKRTLRRLQRRLARSGKLFGIHIPIEKIEDTEIYGKVENNLKEQLEQMKFELSKRLDKITELEMKTRELKNQIIKSPTRDLQLQIQTLKKVFATKEGKIKTFETERRKTEQQIVILQKRITDLQVNYQEQSKTIHDREKRISEMETIMRLGIHKKSARDLIVDLQEKNKILEDLLQRRERDIRNLDKNTYFLRQQLDVARKQVQSLYAKNKKLIAKLQQDGIILGKELDLGVDFYEGTTKFEQEIKDPGNKYKRLENIIKNLKQEITDLRFALFKKNAKNEELSQMMSELKTILAKAKIQADVKKKILKI